MSEQELKQRFFAQYIGYPQEIGYDNPARRLKSTDVFALKIISFGIPQEGTLILKNIESITNEDAMEMFDTRIDKYKSAKYFLRIFNSIGFLTQQEADLCRSKGYLVPFMNLSIEEIISKGWAKYE